MTLRSAWPLVQLGSWAATWSQAAEQTPGNHMALSCHRSHRVDSDPVCCRATDPDMTLFRSVGLNGTMNPVGSTSHQISVAPRLTWLLDAYMATSGSPDIAGILVAFGSDKGHRWPHRPRQGPWQQPVSGSNKKANVSLLLPTFTSSVTPLSTAREAFCFPFFPISPLHTCLS